MKALVVVAAVIVVALSACGPVGDPISAQIYVDACKTPQRKVNDVLIGGTDDCELRFDATDDHHNVRISNPSIVALIGDLSIEDGNDTFTLVATQFRVEAGLAIDAAIVAAPRDRVETAALVVSSNANNVAFDEKTGDAGTVRVSLVADPSP